MDLSFLGGASTVTGSRFLLTTGRSQVLIDCGMFQGSPNETIRNRVPLGMNPADLDAILITHAHLDHCGLLPVVVKDGFKGRIFLTTATAELVELVLLDSGRLQEEFAKRHDRFERRHPPEALAADEKAAAQYQAALEAAVRYIAAELGPKGIRVHAISPGPLATRAASGIPEFDELMDKAQSQAPTRSLVSIDDVGKATAFLALDGAKLITGSVLYIDGGYHIID
jgi:NAD(P)-dependent dehydrogenase (short-subunit alcohol dehydrogenase family)